MTDPNQNTNINNVRIKLDKYVPLKISSEMKEKLEQIQKDEYRGSLADTIRAIILKYFDKN